MMDRDNLTKRGVTLMRMRHDLALAVFVAPAGRAGPDRMLFYVMPGMDVSRTGRRLGMMVMVMVGGLGVGRRSRRRLMVVMGASLGGRGNQGEQRQGGARGECGPDDGCHGSFPVSATLCRDDLYVQALQHHGQQPRQVLADQPWTKRLGAGGVKPHTSARRFEAFHALGHQPSDHAGENVARSRRG